MICLKEVHMKRTVSLILTLVMLASAICVFPTKVGAANDVNRVITAALTIIGYNEGNYASVNANDNGALSIGKLQWHANRALSLMRTIVNSLGAASAKSYIGDDLYNEVVASSTSWSTRKLSSDEKSKFAAILQTSASHTAQDNLARSDVAAYVNHGIQRGITSDMALVYYADIENQYGAGSSGANNGAWAIVNNAKIKLGKSTIDSLDEFHNTIMTYNLVASAYQPRRTRTYNRVKALGWTEEGNDPNPADYTMPTRTLYYNSSSIMTGDDVKWVQAVLYKLGYTIDIDGQFGPATKSTVQSFQTAKGLTSDGVVESNTLYALRVAWAEVDPNAPTPPSPTVTHDLTVNAASGASFAGTSVTFNGAMNLDTSKGTADGCAYSNISPNPQKPYRMTMDYYVKNLVETDPYRNSDQAAIVAMLGSGKTMGYNFSTGKFFIAGGGGGWSGDPSGYVVQNTGTVSAGGYYRFEYVVEASTLTLIVNGTTVATASVSGAFSADQYFIFYPKHVNMDITYTKFEYLDGSGTAVAGSGSGAMAGFVGMNQSGEPYSASADVYNVTFNPSAVTTYTVSFNMNGHGSAIASQTVQAGSTATQPTAPSASGYTFGGWYTNAACTSAFSFSTAINANTTLYAKWTAVHVHSLEYVAAVSATCTGTGTAAHYRCTGCGKLYTTSAATVETTLAALATPALGHDYQVTETTATCTSAGTTTYTCSRCGDSYPVTGEALGHDYFSASHKDPTCTAQGYDYMSCRNCGHSYFEWIPALGHDYVDGYCTRCGAEDPNPPARPGDVDRDGHINASDVSALMKHLVGKTPSVFDVLLADYDGSGKVNSRDVLMLMLDIVNGEV